MYGELLQFGGIQSVPEIGGESLDFVEITAAAGAGSEETAPPVTLPAVRRKISPISMKAIPLFPTTAARSLSGRMWRIPCRSPKARKYPGM